jgi:hypothetical protein
VWSIAAVEWLLCAASDSVNSVLKLSVFLPKYAPKAAENRALRHLNGSACMTLL